MPEEANVVPDLVGVGDILAFNNIIRIASKTEDFLNWVKVERSIRDIDACLEGYKYFLRVAINGLVFSLTHNPSLSIQEDATFYRAEFQGLGIEDIPNTCEKTRLVKTIWLITKGLRKARNWEQLRNSLVSVKEITEPVARISRYYGVGTAGERSNLLRDHTVFTLHNYFNDTSRGRPLGSFVTYLIGLPKEELYLVRAYQGYVLALEFVWRSLLGSEAFLNTSLKDLHLAYDMFGQTTVDDSVNLFGIDLSADSPAFDSNGDIEAKIVELGLITGQCHQPGEQPIEKHRNGLVSWFALDNFYSPTWEELEQMDLGTRWTPFNEGGLKARRTCTKVLRSMINAELPEPDYLYRTDPKSIQRQLDCQFLWGSVSVLDSQKGMVFSGVPAFVTLMLGSVDLRRSAGDKEPILVKTFKHPVDLEKGHNNYSYAIYLEAYGTISDYSGWLIFLDCAGDFSGFAGGLYQMAKGHIDRLHELGYVEHSEVSIDKELFEDYLKEHHVGFEGGAVERLVKQQELVLADAQGKLFELLVFRSLLGGRYGKCVVDISIDSEQIDCMGENETTIDVYECKMGIHTDVDEVIRQVLRKRDTVQREKPGLEVVPHLVLYNRVSEKRKTAVESAGIRLHDNFRREIETMRIYDAGRGQLIGILDYRKD